MTEEKVVEVCYRCEGTPAAPHTCPYLEAIAQDEVTLCNCCSDCCSECIQDI